MNKTVLVLALSQKEYLEWAHDHADEIKATGFMPRWIPAKGVTYAGQRDCYWLAVRNWEKAGYKENMFAYFKLKNIQPYDTRKDQEEHRDAEKRDSDTKVAASKVRRPKGKAGAEDPVLDHVEGGENAQAHGEIDLIVWDLETTGFVAPEAKILEIGAFIVKDGGVESRQWVFQNNIEIPEKIVEITGITQEIITAEGRDPAECLREFLPLLKAARKNVTHNGFRFDIPFLTDYAAHVLEWTDDQRIAAATLIRSTAFDTAVHFKSGKLREKPRPNETYVHFAQRIMTTPAYGVKFNLALCCDEIGVSREGVEQHRALADVGLTHELYKLIQKL